MKNGLLARLACLAGIALAAAGATVAKDIEETPAGDKMVILRDPWGVPIQFLTRVEPMVDF
ncbi:MAG TPA: hypothetical protein ENN81_12220 [Phycisphaerales bacterium]|nr:hypothetical protein [Phycisphaerales bacterium]